VGAAQTNIPPRPLSLNTSPSPNAGEDASPFAAHHQSNCPFVGSRPWIALLALTSISVRSPILTMTGVVCAKLVSGRFASQRTSPVAWSKAMRLDDLPV